MSRLAFFVRPCTSSRPLVVVKMATDTLDSDAKAPIPETKGQYRTSVPNCPRTQDQRNALLNSILTHAVFQWKNHKVPVCIMPAARLIHLRN